MTDGVWVPDNHEHMTETRELSAVALPPVDPTRISILSAIYSNEQSTEATLTWNSNDGFALQCESSKYAANEWSVTLDVTSAQAQQIASAFAPPEVGYEAEMTVDATIQLEWRQQDQVGDNCETWLFTVTYMGNNHDEQWPDNPVKVELDREQVDTLDEGPIFVYDYEVVTTE